MMKIKEISKFIITMFMVMFVTCSFNVIKAHANNDGSIITDEYTDIASINVNGVVYDCVVAITDPDINISTSSNTAIIVKIQLTSNKTDGLKIPRSIKYTDHYNREYVCRIVGVEQNCLNRSKYNNGYSVQGKLDFSNAIYCKTIGNSAFYPDNTYDNSFKFTSIDLGNITKIYTGAFAYNTHITSITANKLKNVADYAFYHCDRLKTAYMKSAKSIGKEAFKNCTKLTSIAFGPNNMTKIGNSAFYNCTNLKTVKVINKDGSKTTKFPKITTIDEKAFAGCGFRSIKLNSANVKSMAFIGNKNLTKVTNTNKKCKYAKDAFLGTPYDREACLDTSYAKK